MSTPVVHVSREGSVSHIRLDDGKANALSPSLMRALNGALDAAEASGDAVVLSGRAGRFCAGFDLQVMMSGVEQARALVTEGADLLMRLFLFPRPLVAACTGHALAGGALVLLSADVRVAADGPFRIGLNEVAIGMPLPILAVEMARARLAATELGRATLLAHIYDPAGAARAGYVDEVAPADEVVSRALDEAKRLSSLSTMAFAATKARLREHVAAHIRATLAEDMERLTPPQG